MILPVFTRHFLPTVLALVAMTFLTTARAQDSGALATDKTADQPPDPEMVRDAGNRAISDLLTDFVTHKDFPKRFAILPMQHDIDDAYFTSQLRNQFSDVGPNNGFELYTRMDDEAWKALLSEIKWGEQFGDTMDPATVQKFGRIQGVQGIIMGRVVSATKDDKGNVHVRITITAFEVETGRQLWGQEKVGETLAEAKPGPPTDWFKIGVYAGGAVALLVIVFGFLSYAKSASRPR